MMPAIQQRPADSKVGLAWPEHPSQHTFPKPPALARGTDWRASPCCSEPLSSLGKWGRGAASTRGTVPEDSLQPCLWWNAPGCVPALPHYPAGSDLLPHLSPKRRVSRDPRFPNHTAGWQERGAPAKEGRTGVSRLMTLARQLFLMSAAPPQAKRPGAPRCEDCQRCPVNGSAPTALHPCQPSNSR